MMQFILITVIWIIAIASMAKILHFSIQHGQWLDKLLNWQYRLRKWSEKNKWYVKPLGLCEMCFAHLMAQLGFIVYCLFMNISGLWVLDNWFLCFVWYFFFVGIATNASLYFIVKLYETND